MIDFLKYIVRVKKDYSYNNLSFQHIILVLLFFLGIFIIIRLSRFDQDFIKTKKLDKFLTIILFIIQVIYYSWYLLTNGDYDPLPLYVCRISAILLCITTFWNLKILEDFAIISGIYGSFIAVILSTPSPFSFPHIMVFSYFVLHFCLGYLALTRLLCKSRIVDFKMFLNACIINFLVLIATYILNRTFSWNYSFLIYPPLFHSVYLKMNSTFYVIGAFSTYFLLLFIGYAIAKLIKNK